MTVSTTNIYTYTEWIKNNFLKNKICWKSLTHYDIIGSQLPIFSEQSPIFLKCHILDIIQYNNNHDIQNTIASVENTYNRVFSNIYTRYLTYDVVDSAISHIQSFVLDPEFIDPYMHTLQHPNVPWTTEKFLVVDN